MSGGRFQDVRLHCVVQFLLKLSFIAIFIFASPYLFSQENVGIGTSVPDSSAVLELSTQLLSSPKGFLVPRITTAQRDAIALPANGLLIYNTTTNQFEFNSGTAAIPIWLPLVSSAGTGTVTSVGLSLPSIFTVSGSPVTGSGTLTATLATQSQNTVFAGPASGVNAAPTFRVLDALDIPNLDAGKITSGTFPIARGGTNSTATPTAGGISYGTGTGYAFTGMGIAGQVLTSSGAGAPAWVFPTIPFSSITSGTNTSASMVVGNGATLGATGTGTLTANQYVGSGSTTNAIDLATAEVTGIVPIAKGGTNSTATPTAGGIGYGTGTAYGISAAGTSGQVLSSNGAGVPSFRSLTASDISSGTLSVSQGGTGATTLTGILAGNGTTSIAGRTITGTANQVTVTNGNGATADPTLAIADNPVLPGTAAATTPSGTTAQRPVSPSNGMMRYNTETAKFEFYQNSEWVNPLGSTLNGSGAVNTLPKFTGSTSMGNSNIYDNDTSISIGTTTPSASAQLEMNSTSQGFLMPRMTLAQRNLIPSPATGLIVYITDPGSAGIYNYDGTSWALLQLFSSGGIGSTTVVRKTDNESYGNTSTGTTFHNDQHLSLSFGAGEVWQIEGYADVICTSATPDFKMTFGYTGTGNIKVGYHSNGSSITNFASGVWTGFDVSSPTLVMGANIPLEIFYSGIVESTTAGTLNFKWAQNQTNATQVTVQKNSYLRATRIQ